MSYDCFCDYDPPEFYNRYKPRARKQHHCYECGGDILPGEQYEYVVGKWYGDVDVYKTCERCHDLRQWVTNNVPCFCWAHGGVFDDARSAVEEAHWRAHEETIGLRFGLLRRIHQIEKHNEARRKFGAVS